MRVTAKLATTLDGKIATKTGESKWITSSEARAKGHELRRQNEGVLVGIGTVLADDPELTVRHGDIPDVQPFRIILDTHARTPPNARIFGEDRRVIILCGEASDPKKLDALKASGAVILFCALGDDGRLDLNAALKVLEAFGLSSLFIEGGGQTVSSFLRAELVHTLHWFRAPMIIGNDGIPALAALNVTALGDALRLHRESVRSIGPDIWEVYEFMER